MLRRMNKNEKEALLMMPLMIPAVLLFLVLGSIDPASLPLASQPLPFGLPARFGSLPVTIAILYIGMGLTGLVLALLPATLSRKKTLLAGLLLLAVAVVMGFFSRSPFELCCWSLLGGIGCTMNICAWISMGVAYFPRHCAMVVGLMNGLVAVSNIVAHKIHEILHAIDEERGKLPLLPALLGMLILILLYIWMRHFFQQRRAADERRFIPPEVGSPASSVWSLGPLLLFLAAVCLPLSAVRFDDLYNVYIREMLELPKMMVRSALDFAMGAALLSPLAGWLADRYGAKKTLLIALPTLAAAGGLISCGWHLPLDIIMLLAFLVGFGLTAVFYVNILAALIQSVLPTQSMRAAGMFFVAFNLGMPVAGALFMYLKERVGWTALVLLQLVLPLVLATVLVWLAQRILKSADKTSLPG